MKQKLLDELMEVSEEEQKYLDGQGDIERQLYVKEKIEEIDRELLLKRGQHYVEIMYVAQGSITHCIEGKELVLHKGDVFRQFKKRYGMFAAGEDFDLTFGLMHTAEILVKMLSMRPDKLQTITPDNFRHLAKDFNVTLSEEFLYDK